MTFYYDRQGQPLTRDQWAALFEKGKYKRVALTTVGEAEVSTVWLGIDYSYGDSEPLIFETMVFGGPLDELQRRYPTEAEARAGHERTVNAVRETQP